MPNMYTTDALKAIRKALRRPGTKAEVATCIGDMPTTKAAISALLGSIGEVDWTSDEGDGWSFRQPGDDDAEAFEDREGLQTMVLVMPECVRIYPGGI